MSVSCGFFFPGNCTTVLLEVFGELIDSEPLMYAFLVRLAVHLPLTLATTPDLQQGLDRKLQGMSRNDVGTASSRWAQSREGNAQKRFTAPSLALQTRLSGPIYSTLAHSRRNVS